MGKKRRAILKVRDRAQRAALTSPARQEVLEVLEAVGPATVRDLAGHLGRTPHALQYHVRHLVKVGLMVQTGSRRSGARNQAIYDVVADRIEIPPSAVANDRDGFTARTVRAILNRTERDYAALTKARDPRLATNDVMVGRARGRLSASARREVARHLEAIQKIFTTEMRREHPPQARVTMWTCTFGFLPDAED